MTVFCVVKHKMVWIVIGKVFTNKSFTENKAVINVKTVQNMLLEISAGIKYEFEN